MTEKVTKKLLVKVAKQRFATNGLENTTMDDIAQASEKGRRTLYTYFKSKEEIYYEVMEGELDRLADKLAEIAAQIISPREKVIEIINTHFDVIRETVMQNGNLQTDIYRNIWVVEKVRKNFDLTELELFQSVLTEGNNAGEFDVDNINLTADIWHNLIKGLEVPYVFGCIDPEYTKHYVNKLVNGALCLSPHCVSNT